MLRDLGHVRELSRFSVKSMAGTALESAVLGWHGLAGDRRFGFRRVGEESGMPWLTASRLPQLLCYQPAGLDERTGEPLPTHVRTPTGETFELKSAALADEISERFGSRVELMKLQHGIFDETPISVISLATIAGIGVEAGVELDRRRFRANIVLDTEEQRIFHEDDWVGGTLLFGNEEPHPAVSVTRRDLRCSMINLDPDTAVQDPRVMKTVVRLNGNHAGVYGTVLQTGVIRVGDPVRLWMDTRR